MIHQATRSVAYIVARTQSNLPYFPLLAERKKIEITDLGHLVSTNIKSDNVNDIIENELKFDIGNILANNPKKDPLYIVTLSLRVSKILDRH